ncbi:MAG: coiled-coil domain-containing protein [Candidatus Heimdallarchaeaceae archaeon]
MTVKDVLSSPEFYQAVSKIVDEKLETIKLISEGFTRLQQAVEELAEAQKRTEKRIDRLEKVVEELAEAQKRTEKRIDRLEKVVEELAEAQKRTEKRVEELAEAQKRTEHAVAELAHQVGRLSDTVGFSLEDIGRYMIPPWLKKEYQIEVGELEQKYFTVGEKEYEINFYAEGEIKGEPCVVVGECKNRIREKNIVEFEKLVNRVKEQLLPKGRIIKIFFGYSIPPSVRRKAQEFNIITVAPYQTMNL